MLPLTRRKLLTSSLLTAPLLAGCTGWIGGSEQSDYSIQVTNYSSKSQTIRVKANDTAGEEIISQSFKLKAGQLKQTDVFHTKPDIILVAQNDDDFRKINYVQRQEDCSTGYRVIVHFTEEEQFEVGSQCGAD